MGVVYTRVKLSKGELKTPPDMLREVKFTTTSITTNQINHMNNIEGTTIPTAATYSIDDTAEILAVCPMTVYRQVSAGKIPASKIGRVYRVSHTTIQNLVAGIK